MTAPLDSAVAPPSIQRRLGAALTLWSLLWGLAVGAAVWLAATKEVDELLDDALQSSAGLIALIVSDRASEGSPTGGVPTAGVSDRFAWQLTDTDGRLLTRSSRAPDRAWQQAAVGGFSDTADWRIFGMPMVVDGRMLYVAQSREERQEARAEVASGAILAALAMGLLGHVWLRSRVRTELRPLRALSERVEAWNLEPEQAATALGRSERSELAPLHHALLGLASRLSSKLSNERAFAAHAAHALRTPLAGIDTQLALALRDCTGPQRERLQRIRDASTRLQAVVVALLGLFRTGVDVQRTSVDIAAMVAHLPVPALGVVVAPSLHVEADADLLAAALVNLLDNAQRHGATHVRFEPGAGGGLRLYDDGPGVGAERRAALQQALDRQSYEGVTGLGLMLADRVARAHGGRLRLPQVAQGFVAELGLGPAETPR